MNVKTKLILNVLAAFLVFGMISAGVTSVLSEKTYKWNSDVNIESTVSDLNLTIYGSINSSQLFESQIVNGEVANDVWNISPLDTTFTTEKKVIIISLSFVNQSTQSLRISLDGILIDSLERFTTKAQDSNGLAIAIEKDPETSLGSLSTVLPAGNNEIKVINLIYTLEKTNLAIENELQSITVTIDLNEEL